MLDSPEIRVGRKLNCVFVCCVGYRTLWEAMGFGQPDIELAIQDARMNGCEAGAGAGSVVRA